MQNKILSIIIEDEPGALSRVTGLFSQRNYNISALNVSKIQNSKYSNIILTTNANSQKIEQIIKQLHKLINVLKVKEISDNDFISKELALINIKANKKNRSNIQSLCQIANATAIKVTAQNLIVQITNTEEEINNLINLIEQETQIEEISRTGICAIKY